MKRPDSPPIEAGRFFILLKRLEPVGLYHDVNEMTRGNKEIWLFVQY